MVPSPALVASPMSQPSVLSGQRSAGKLFKSIIYIKFLLWIQLRLCSWTIATIT